MTPRPSLARSKEPLRARLASVLIVAGGSAPVPRPLVLRVVGPIPYNNFFIAEGASLGKKTDQPSFDAVRQKLAELQFQIQPLDGGRYLVRKYGCATVLEQGDGGTAVVVLRPGKVIRGELSRLIDRGYQKFFKTPDAEVPAVPEDLRALADFQKELRFAQGLPMLYNESLGTVSDRYLYDRIWHRDEGKQPRPWLEAVSQMLRQ